MALYKSGTHDSSIIVSSSVCACVECDYTEMASGSTDGSKKCPVCGAEMRVISASAEESSDNQEQ